MHWAKNDNCLRFTIERTTHHKNIYDYFSVIIFDTYLEKHVMNAVGFESLGDIEKYCDAFSDGYDNGLANYSKEFEV
jgi:hypothetical protein